MPQQKTKLYNRLISGYHPQRKTVGIWGFFVKGIFKEAIRTINHEDIFFFKTEAAQTTLRSRVQQAICICN